MMDAHKLIPLSDSVKTKLDVASIGTAGAAFFKLIPWAELAAFAAFVYTGLRILELLWGWYRKKL